MAYFSNGSEGMYLDDQCAECIHAREDALCPIAAVQLEFNYDQQKKGNGDLKKAMSFLINDDGDCQMLPFIDEIRGKVNRNRKCFQRQLTFGDIEQIEALK
jgi:hypothetical protein